MFSRLHAASMSSSHSAGRTENEDGCPQLLACSKSIMSHVYGSTIKSCAQDVIVASKRTSVSNCLHAACAYLVCHMRPSLNAKHVERMPVKAQVLKIPGEAAMIVGACTSGTSHGSASSTVMQASEACDVWYFKCFAEASLLCEHHRLCSCRQVSPWTIPRIGAPDSAHLTRTLLRHVWFASDLSRCQDLTQHLYTAYRSSSLEARR